MHPLYTRTSGPLSVRDLSMCTKLWKIAANMRHYTFKLKEVCKSSNSRELPRSLLHCSDSLLHAALNIFLKEDPLDDNIPE